jgi:prepilin-type N-terminal cleavage/methylation domain-containing protein
MRTTRQIGFTLLEVMAVLVVLGVLAMQAYYYGTTETKRARRSEVHPALGDIARAQSVYFEEHARFAGTFQELGFTLDGAVPLDPTTVKARIYTYVISQPWGPQSYYVTATGNIDDDPFPDVFVLESGRP